MNTILDFILKSSPGSLQEFISHESLDICSMRDLNNLTLLHICVASNKDEHMRVILHSVQGAPKNVYEEWINHQSKEGFTALLLAVSKGFYQCTELLVQFGADQYAKTGLGLDVIHLCAQNNNALILSFFLERGLFIHSKDNKGGSALHWAAYMGSLSVLSILLTLNMSSNSQDQEGRTPLHLSILSANEKAARKLLIYGANPNILDKRGRSPFDCAMESNAVGIVEMLRPLTLCEKVSCKTQLREPPRSLKHVVSLVIFLTFSFAFVMSFCTRKKDPMSYVFIVLFCGILADLFYLITKDPGYVKDGKGTSFKDLYLKGNDEVCTECRILRPPRSRHCYYCGKCVYRYDHHCQWVNNCIGLYNNNFFFAFLAMLVLLILVVDYIAITDFIYPHDEGLVSENTAQPPAAIVMVISTLALYPVSLLFWVQVKNYSADLTSSERLSKNRKKRNTSCFLKNCLKMCLNKV